MMTTVLRSLGLVLAAAMAMSSAPAADGIESRPLKFAKNASSATVKGTLAGRQTIDYKLRAKAGQQMSVALKSANAGLSFNVLPPGSLDVAIPGAIGLQDWQGALPADGEYTVRMYLPRSAARRGEKAAYSLTVAITGGSAAAAGPSGTLDAAIGRAGEGKFNARGEIPCAQHLAQPMMQCKFGVARAGGGTAAVIVNLPDGRKRMIFFDKGKATGADLSQADGGAAFRTTRRGDLNMIEAGNERYEIPDAVVFGG